MLKTGIWKTSQLAHRSSLFGRPRTISLRLLREAFGAGAAAVPLVEEIVRDLRLSSGVYRTTTARRFDPVQAEINRIVLDHFPAQGTLLVRDWATSDALAASEWAAQLSRDFPAVDFEASDLLLFLVECSHPLFGTCILEPQGQPLQYVRTPFVVSLTQSESSCYPINRLVAMIGRPISRTPAALCSHLAWKGFPDSAVLRQGYWSFRQIPLIHPSALQFHRENPWFRLRLHSVFDVAPDPAHVIRTMNILNRAYFPNDRIASAATAVFRSLAPGGLWVLGNSGEPSSPRFNISILQRTGDGFHVVHRIGSGSEVEQIVTKV